MKDKIIEIIELFIGLRKFLVIGALYAIGVSFRLKGLITGAEMVDLMKNTTIAFMASNSIERAAGMVSSYFDYQTPMSPVITNPGPIGPIPPGPSVSQEAQDAQVIARTGGQV
jgi:hypothetical protein